VGRLVGVTALDSSLPDAQTLRLYLHEKRFSSLGRAVPDELADAQTLRLCHAPVLGYNCVIKSSGQAQPTVISGSVGRAVPDELANIEGVKFGVRRFVRRFCFFKQKLRFFRNKSGGQSAALQMKTCAQSSSAAVRIKIIICNRFVHVSPVIPALRFHLPLKHLYTE
jgi:hypothetical protein